MEYIYYGSVARGGSTKIMKIMAIHTLKTDDNDEDSDELLMHSLSAQVNHASAPSIVETVHINGKPLRME